MKRDLLIFTIGAIIYPIIEMIWRGYSHYSMAIAGGICMVLICRICCEILDKKSFITKGLAGCLVITGVELGIGILFNKILLLNVWDYSDLPLNILGQICLPFSLIWFIFTFPAMFVCKKITLFLEKPTEKFANSEE